MNLHAKIRKNYQECLRIMSLEYEEFLYLLEVFSHLWETHYQDDDLKGNLRSKPKLKEDTRISLRGSATKLLFILSYLKENPAQCYHGLVFEMSQAKVSLWIKPLMPNLNTILKMTFSPF